MRTIPLVFVTAFLGVMNDAYALCVPGTIDSCTLGGKQGTRTCGINGFFGPCEVPTEPQPPSPSGTVQPKYKILTVVFAPPGTQGGGSTSSVTYGSGSTTGSTVSASNSFKQSYSISVTKEVGFLGTGGSLGASFGYGRNSSNSNSLDIKKAISTEINHRGPSIDGIDHDRDQI